MTAPRPAGAPNRVQAWLMTHRKQALAGGAAVGVAALALISKRRAGASDDSDSAASLAGQSGLAGTSGDGSTAGLTGTPTNSDDIESWVQQQLDAQNQTLDNALSGLDDTSTPTTTRKRPTPAPKPGKGTYTVRKGDTLRSIALAVYGSDAAWAIRDLIRANPELRGFSPTAKLNYFAGHYFAVPVATPRPTPSGKPKRGDPPATAEPAGRGGKLPPVRRRGTSKPSPSHAAGTPRTTRTRPAPKPARKPSPPKSGKKR